MRAGKMILAIVGALMALFAVGLLAGGGGLFWAYGTQRDAGGFFTSSSIDLSSDQYALASADIDLGSRPGDWFPSGRLATVRISVEGDNPVFVGIGSSDDVNDYLSGVGYTTVTGIDPRDKDVSYRSTQGGRPASPPAAQSFWVTSAEGAGPQTITWDLEQGNWAVVIMNSDASAGVSVRTSAGARTELVALIAIGLLVGGLLIGGAAAVMMVLGFRSPPQEAEAISAPVYGSYPVRIEAQLDPALSRWQWLFKWLIALPHFVILGFLWIAFVSLTVIAGIAILITGRYPRAIFDFNVGVLRWSWRVSYYSYGALGTDRYPPFTLADTDYPARLDVAYPEELSRGLVLVKWWLLAIPHYLIVGLLTSGLVWWTTDLNRSGNSVLEWGGGLIGVLVLVAAIGLLFTGRYPRGLFDLVIGLNRWVYRVAAYAALMTDEYPPFRLDTGGAEPPTAPPVPPDEPGGVPTLAAAEDSWNR